MNAIVPPRYVALFATCLTVAVAGCLDKAPVAPCHGVAEALAQAGASPAGQRIEVCGAVSGAARSVLVLTQASPTPQSLPLIIDPAAAEQPDIAALLRAVEGRATGAGIIEARVSGVLVTAGPAPGAPALKVLSVADLKGP
jgi:hypothetical protein